MNAYETAACIVFGAALAETLFFGGFTGVMEIAERRYAKKLAGEHAKLSYAQLGDNGNSPSSKY